jgi:hypothetical protein
MPLITKVGADRALAAVPTMLGVASIAASLAFAAIPGVYVLTAPSAQTILIELVHSDFA